MHTHTHTHIFAKNLTGTLLKTKHNHSPFKHNYMYVCIQSKQISCMDTFQSSLNVNMQLIFRLSNMLLYLAVE